MNVTQKREFLGKTENFKDRVEKKFNQRMLKAYLNGKTTFKFKFDIHEVLQSPKQRNPKEVVGNGLSPTIKYPFYSIPFHKRYGKNMTKV